MGDMADILSRYTNLGSMSAYWIDYMGIVSVKSYGAVGDGATDDTAAIQDAIDAAIAAGQKLVYLPHGTYLNTGLDDTTSVIFLGDNASFTGSEYTVTDWSVLVDSAYVLAITGVLTELTTTDKETLVAAINELVTSSPKTLLTTQGDMMFRNATVPTRLAKGTALQTLQMNAAANAPEWADSPQSILTSAGDLLVASAANTLARLAKGTAGQFLRTKPDLSGLEWSASVDSVLTAAGDMLYASAANTLARLAKGAMAQNICISTDGSIVWSHGVKFTAGTTVLLSAITETHGILYAYESALKKFNIAKSGIYTVAYDFKANVPDAIDNRAVIYLNGESASDLTTKSGTYVTNTVNITVPENNSEIAISVGTNGTGDNYTWLRNVYIKATITDISDFATTLNT